MTAPHFRARQAAAAQRAMANKPSMETIRRVNEAMLHDGTPVIHMERVERGWRVGIYDSPYGAGMLLVTATEDAERPDGAARASLCEEVAIRVEAEAWIGRLVGIGSTT